MQGSQSLRRYPKDSRQGALTGVNALTHGFVTLLPEVAPRGDYPARLADAGGPTVGDLADRGTEHVR